MALFFINGPIFASIFAYASKNFGFYFIAETASDALKLRSFSNDKFFSNLVTWLSCDGKIKIPCNYNIRHLRIQFVNFVLYYIEHIGKLLLMTVWGSVNGDNKKML